jgi:restriction system protein
MNAHQLKKDDFYFPILRLLDMLGGSASIEEMEQRLVEEFEFTDADLTAAHEKSGTPIIFNKVAWARSYLREAGLVANEKRGVWILTENGRNGLAAGQQAVRDKVVAAMRDYNARRKAAAEATAAEEVPPDDLSEDGMPSEDAGDWRDRKR